MSAFLEPNEILRTYSPTFQVKILPHYEKIFSKIDAFSDGIPQLKKGTPGSSGYDLLACIPDMIELFPGETKLIPTGVSIYIGDSHIEAQVRPRSGKGNKGLVVGNIIGTIDSDYQGEIFVCAWNRLLEGKIKIFPGEAIAQLVFCPVIHPKLELVKDFSLVTERNYNGFGHTDFKTSFDIKTQLLGN